MDSEGSSREGQEKIAIIGMAGRFAGAASVDALWENLCAGVESVRFFTEEELLAAGVDPRLLGDPRYVRARAALDGVDLFDAAFFGMSPHEAAMTDPQHRLFLECAWEAMERAGYDPSRYEGAVGVFAGAGASGYLLHNVAPRCGADALADLAALIGNEKDHLTTRVAFKLNLRGPSVTVQTACSTSLVAVQLACQSLLGYQADMALAGGVSIGFPLGAGYVHQEGSILSPDGHCRAFDAKAAGTVAGDGAGVVVLKRLRDALADGDHIHAVILAAAVNNDGSQKAGYTAPSVDGQAEVIAMAHALAEVDPGTVTYVEAHGTGTPLGDPIEVAALTQAFRAGTSKRGYCALGSLKTNIGHLNTTAGVAGLIKAALALEREAIPPVLHYRAPNPAINFASSPFYVNASRLAWPRGEAPRRAGVSSFGFGGTNAHVVLEEAPEAPAEASCRPCQLLLLSAKSAPALEAATANLARFLAERPEADLADVAFTLMVGRRAFEHRRMLVCASAEKATAALSDPTSGRAITAVTPDDARPRVVFMFPGQGVQRTGMAEELYRTEPVFRRHVDRSAAILRPHLGLDLREVLCATGGAGEDRLRETALAQPALFVVEHALAQFFIEAGAAPQAMIGHSLGEYVAATLAEVLTLEDALWLVAERGRLLQSLPPGAMLAVRLPERELRRLLGRELSIAAVNGPSATVAAGPADAIDALERRLAAAGVESRRLLTSRAFHSAMMDPALGALRERAARVRLRPPKIPYLSNVTGAWITADEATDPAYWARHMRETVLFSQGLDRLLEGPPALLLEVGPGRHLSALVHARAAASHEAIPCMARPGSSEASSACVLQALGRLWLAGAELDHKPLYAEERRRRMPLPTYPFERQRCWIEAPRSGAAEAAGGADRADRPASADAAIEGERRRLSALERSIREELAIRPVESYPGLVEALTRFCAAHLCAYLRACGVSLDPGAPVASIAVRERLRILPKFERLYGAFLEILADSGALRVEEGAIHFTERARSAEPPAALRGLLDDRYPEFRGLFDFIDHCARSYPDTLTGRAEPIGVLYPGGSSELLARVERTTVEHRSERIYIALLCEAMRGMAGAPRGRPLRILEVGGGQGLLTWPLMAALEGRDVEYHFTDLGRTFVDDARAEAERRGFGARMTFGILDISRAPRAQGYDAPRFDVVLAFNVVHATRDVEASLDHLAALLAPGGALALIEIVRTRPWDVLTWGLAEGWWYYDDAHRRGSPLLSLSSWEEVLRGRGFARVEAYPQDEAERARTDHGLILARERREPRSRQEEQEVLSHARPSLRAPYVAPRDATEQRIAAVCAELLGVDRVGVHDDFFELGADSLIMLRLTDRLRGELGREIPPHAAFRGSTVERIARAISGARAPDAASPAVPIQPNGSRPPLFFVHPAAGVVFPYIQLARQLGPDQPFYGLQALGLDGQREPDTRIEDMARHYIEAMRAVSPRGPYYLGGFSFGCLVAFEIAQQLTRTGDEVAFLAMVDEPAPVTGHRPSPLIMAELLATGIAKSIWPYLHDYAYLASASDKQATPRGGGEALKSAPRRTGREILESFVARATIANYVPRESRLLALRQPAVVPMFRLFSIHVREALAYAPKAYPHRVTLFKATKLGGRNASDPTQGWGLLAAGGVDVHDVPGEHLTVLRQPHVRMLAEKLGACLSKAQAAALSSPPRR